MRDRLFPNLFIIGAMKSGTSSLHEYLSQHPEIFMAKMKEPQFFAPHTTRTGHKWGQGNPYPEPGMGWYLKLFEEAGPAKYAGEASVSYTARPWVAGCEERIRAFNPEAKLIYILRDPVERAISQYWHFVADGREDRDMLTAIQRKEDYAARSHYAMQLRPYLGAFGREGIYVLTLEELEARPEPTLRRLFEWLQVDASCPIQTDKKFNVGRSHLRQTRRLRVFLDTFQKRWTWQRVRPWLPGFVPSLLEKLTYKSVRRDAVDTGSTVAYLRPIQLTQVRELSSLVGRDFPEWTTLHGQELLPESGTRATSLCGRI